MLCPTQATKLDTERGVDLATLVGPPVDIESASLEAVTQRLDLAIYYLRRVHLFDYYSGRAFATLPELVRACGRFCARARWDAAAPDGTARLWWSWWYDRARRRRRAVLTSWRARPPLWRAGTDRRG